MKTIFGGGFFRTVWNSLLFRSVLVYGFAGTLDKAIPFFLLPLLTAYLSTEDYGIVTMFSVLINILVVFIGFGTQNTIQIKYFQQDRYRLSLYVGNCFLLSLVSFALVGAFLLAFPRFVAQTTGLSGYLSGLAILIAFGSFFSSVVLNLWQTSKQEFSFSLFMVFHTTLNSLLSVVLIVLVGMKWEGRIWAIAVTALFSTFLGIVFLLRNKWLELRYDQKYCREALRVGLPLAPHDIGTVLANAVDRLMITQMVGITATGIFSVGAQIGMLTLLLTSSFNRAWAPWLFGKLSSSPSSTLKTKLVSLTYLYGFLILLFSVLLGLFAPGIFRVFIGKDFSSAAAMVFWVALGFAFNGIQMMFINYVYFAERTPLVALTTFVSATIKIVVSYFLIRENGPIGAAQGAAIGHLVSCVLSAYFAAKVYPMPWLKPSLEVLLQK